MARTSTRPRSSSPLNLPGAFQLFRPSKDLVLKNIWIFGPLYAVPLVFSLHSWLWSPIPSAHHHWTDRFDSFSSGWSFSPSSTYALSALIGFSIFWLLFVLVIGTVVQIMSQAAQLEASENKALHFQRLWNVVKELGWRMFGLYMMIFLFVFVGLILLIIPGLIMMRRYFLAPYIMLDEKCSVKEAMVRSASMTKPFAGSIWGIIGVMVLIDLTGVIPFVGNLVAVALGALYSVAPALRYQQLKRLA